MSSLNLKKLLCSILVLLIFQGAISQIPQDTLLVNYLGQEKGLLQLNAQALTKDNYGFLWVGTKNGLHRFDGYNFEPFTVNASDSLAIPEDHIKGLVAQGDTLWIATNSSGIIGYELQKDRFFPLKHNYQKSPLHLSHNIFKLDSKQLLFSFNDRFILYDVRTRNQVLVELPENTENNLVTDALKVSDEVILLATSGSGLLKYNIASAQFQSINLPSVEDTSQIEKWGDKYLIGTSFGLYEIDSKFTKSKELITGAAIYNIQKLADGSHIVGSQVNVYHLNRQGEITKYIVKDKSKKIYNPLRANAIVQDTLGNLWLGTEGKGVLHHNVFQKKFSTTRLKFDELNNVSAINIFPFLKTNDSTLWMGTSFGTVKHNLNTDTKKLYIPQNYNTIYDLAVDKNGTLWAAGLFDGLLKYNRRTDSFQQYIKSTPTSTLLPSNRILEIIPLENGNLMLCTGSDGIIEFDIKTETYKPIYFDGVTINRARISFKDSNGNLWLGTDEGVYKLSKKFKILKQYTASAPSGERLSSNVINSINEDSKGIIWIGTSAGITKLNPRTHRTSFILKQKDFPNDFVYSILIDNQDHIWASTNKGLVRYNPTAGTFRNYTSEDGLQNDEFNTKSAYKDEDGLFYFGGIDGYNIFNPNDIVENVHQPSTYIKSVELFNETIDEYTIHEDSLTFMSNENVITFNYSSQSYLSPEKTFYRYKLENFDAAWSPPTQRQSTTYTNLAPGTYEFLISASQLTGAWSEPKAMSLVIKPQWFQTLLFKVAVVLSIIVLILLYFLYKTRSLRRDKLKLERIVHQRTQDLIVKNTELKNAYEVTSKQKDNISFLMKELNHRVKNNLQIISSLLNIQARNTNEEAKQSLNIAKSRIMSIAYIQNAIETNQEQTNIKEFLHSFCEKVVQLLSGDHEMSFEVEYNLAETGFHKINTTLLGLIINELLTNTFKYAFDEYAQGNTLTIACALKDGYIDVIVKDNGKGYDKANQREDALGLSLVEDMARQLGAELFTNSTNGVKNTLRIKV